MWGAVGMGYGNVWGAMGILYGVGIPYGVGDGHIWGGVWMAVHWDHPIGP